MSRSPTERAHINHAYAVDMPDYGAAVSEAAKADENCGLVGVKQ